MKKVKYRAVAGIAGIIAVIVVFTACENGTGIDSGTPGLVFTLINDGTEYCVGGNKELSGAVVIPASYDGKPVTSIDWFCFSGNITSVTIPASVTYIYSRAFWNCGNLTSIMVDEGNLDYASKDGILYDKTKTALVAVPEGKSDAVTISASVTYIPQSAFWGCNNITSITVDEGNPNYASEGGILYDKAKTTLIAAPGAISGAVTIPASVIDIGDFAFDGCKNLNAVTIPNGVAMIGDCAFASCESLTEITIPNSVTNIGDLAFWSCGSLTSVTFQSAISADNLGSKDSFSDSFSYEDIFPGDLADKYLAGGAGTYTKANTEWDTDMELVPLRGYIPPPPGISSVWTKQ